MSSKVIFKKTEKELVNIKAHEILLGGNPVIKQVEDGFTITVIHYKPMKKDEVRYGE